MQPPSSHLLRGRWASGLAGSCQHHALGHALGLSAAIWEFSSLGSSGWGPDVCNPEHWCTCWTLAGEQPCRQVSVQQQAMPRENRTELCELWSKCSLSHLINYWGHCVCNRENPCCSNPTNRSVHPRSVSGFSEYSPGGLSCSLGTRSGVLSGSLNRMGESKEWFHWHAYNCRGWLLCAITTQTGINWSGLAEQIAACRSYQIRAANAERSWRSQKYFQSWGFVKNKRE